MDMHVYKSKEKDFTKVIFHKDGTILMSTTLEPDEPNSLIINTQSLNGIGNLRYVGFEHDKEYQDYLKRKKDKSKAMDYKTWCKDQRRKFGLF